MELTCKWCGYHGAAEDFDFRSDGLCFWCPDCDALTFIDPKDEAERRILLILESGGASTELTAPKTGFRKRLSPLRYPGGKSRLIDQIYARLLPNKMDTFVELFAGGASLGLSLLDAGAIKTLVLNDLDPMVYAFWDSVLHSPGYLMARLERFSPNMAAFLEAKDILGRAANGDRSIPQDMLAWSFFLLNRTCFGGIITAGPLCGKKGSNSELLSRWNPKNLLKRLTRISEMAENIKLYSMDAEQFLTSTDYWWDEKTTFFIDPPYVKMGDSLYVEKFPEEKHVSLAETLVGLYLSYPCADVVVTYDDCPLVRELYPIATVECVPRAYSLTPPCGARAG